METLKITPIDEIEDMADGVPVLAVEGTVKYAADITRGVAKASRKEWTKQFFVLGSETADIACSMWDAEGSEMTKGEKIHIENTQNKKGQWSGMVKGSYMKEEKDKDGMNALKVRKHTLEIRANQVKITQSNDLSSGPTIDTRTDPHWPEAPKVYPEAYHKIEEQTGYSPLGSKPKIETGVDEARKHLMQSANLYNLCVAAVDKDIAPNMPNIAQTSEQFQAAVGTLFIEASRAGFVSKMPQSQIK